LIDESTGHIFDITTHQVKTTAQNGELADQRIELMQNINQG